MALFKLIHSGQGFLYSYLGLNLYSKRDSPHRTYQNTWKELIICRIYVNLMGKQIVPTRKDLLKIFIYKFTSLTMLNMKEFDKVK